VFLDEKELFIQAGRGGDGAILFRREIYVPRGGPDGGDGGNGGSVFVEGKSNLHALSNLARIIEIKAEPGQVGGHRRSTGKSGAESTIEVPLGTVIEFLTGNKAGQTQEIITEGERVRIAKGGNGGWGNWRFRSSVQQAPERANPGQGGEEFDVKLTLKLIADVGLVGLPNAGKSTLLSVISAARPKIAGYPFTTIEPQLGVAEVRRGREVLHVVVADLPGLIEGASGGKGLGARFLKHIERTKVILHCLDASASTEDIVASYHVVRKELEQWSPALAEKPEFITLTKCELISQEERAERITALERASDHPVHAISAVTGEGLVTLLTTLV
jgi:GTP-binding protein